MLITSMITALVLIISSTFVFNLIFKIFGRNINIFVLLNLLLCMFFVYKVIYFAIANKNTNMLSSKCSVFFDIGLFILSMTYMLLITFDIVHEKNITNLFLLCSVIFWSTVSLLNR